MIKVSQEIGEFSWTIDNMKNPPSNKMPAKCSNIRVTSANGFEVASLDDSASTVVANTNSADLLPPYGLTMSNS